MSRIFDWIEEQASSILKILYITYMVTAVATYFSEGGRQADVFNALFGSYSAWVLAFALSVHAYFTARNMKSNFVTIAALRDAQAGAIAQSDTAQAAKYTQQIAGQWMQFRINLGFLVLLLGFDIWNQLQYLIATWHPQTTALSGPPQLQLVIRATIIPVLFLGVAFMTKSIPTLVEQIQHEANTFARDVFNAGRKQWKAGLHRMAQEGQDVTALMVELIEDPSARAFLQKVHPYIAPKSSQAPLAPPTLLPGLPAPSHNGHQSAPPVFADLAEDPGDDDAVQMNAVAVNAIPRPAPKPNTLAFLNLLKSTAREMQQEHVPLTVYALAQRLAVTQTDLLAAIGRLVAQARSRLRPGQEVTDTTVQALGMLLDAQAAMVE